MTVRKQGRILGEALVTQERVKTRQRKRTGKKRKGKGKIKGRGGRKKEINYALTRGRGKMTKL